MFIISKREKKTHSFEQIQSWWGMPIRVILGHEVFFPFIYLFLYLYKEFFEAKRKIYDVVF